MAEETGRRGVLGGESAAGFDTAMVRPLSLLSCWADSQCGIVMVCACRMGLSSRSSRLWGKVRA